MPSPCLWLDTPVHCLTGAMKCFRLLSEKWQLQSLEDQRAAGRWHISLTGLSHTPLAVGGFPPQLWSLRWTLCSPTGATPAQLPSGTSRDAAIALLMSQTKMGQRLLHFESSRSIKGSLEKPGNYFWMEYFTVDRSTWGAWKTTAAPALWLFYSLINLWQMGQNYYIA